jgi:hypothetical protein
MAHLTLGHGNLIAPRFSLSELQAYSLSTLKMIEGPRLTLVPILLANEKPVRQIQFNPSG